MPDRFITYGERRHSVAQIICHGQHGEIRKHDREGQEDQLGALGLVTNAVVRWNSIYMQAALDHTRLSIEVQEEDESRLLINSLANGLIKGRASE